MKYTPGPGAGYSKAQAQVLGELLEALGTNFKPADLVEMARPARSPLHSMFEWDDTAAAEGFRLAQARHHVNRLEVVITTAEGEETMKAYHSIVLVSEAQEKVRRYFTVASTAADEGMREQVIQKALAEAQAWKSRYEKYQRIFGEVFRAIESVSVPRRKKRRKATTK